MKDLIDEIYLNGDLNNKTKTKLLGVLFCEAYESKDCKFRNLMYYLKELIDKLKKI